MVAAAACAAAALTSPADRRLPHAGNAPCARTRSLPRRLTGCQGDICQAHRCVTGLQNGTDHTPGSRREESLRARSGFALRRRAPTSVVGRSQHRSLRVRGTVRCLRSQSTVDDGYAGLPVTRVVRATSARLSDASRVFRTARITRQEVAARNADLLRRLSLHVRQQPAARITRRPANGSIARVWAAAAHSSRHGRR